MALHPVVTSETSDAEIFECIRHMSDTPWLEFLQVRIDGLLDAVLERRGGL